MIREMCDSQVEMKCKKRYLCYKLEWICGVWVYNWAGTFVSIGWSTSNVNLRWNLGVLLGGGDIEFEFSISRLNCIISVPFLDELKIQDSVDWSLLPGCNVGCDFYCKRSRGGKYCRHISMKQLGIRWSKILISVFACVENRYTSKRKEKERH